MTTGRLIKYIARDMILIESQKNGEHVMNDKFEMSQGLGHQVEMALARCGWTKFLLNRATEGDFFTHVRDVLEGRAQIVPIEFTPVAQAIDALLEDMEPVTVVIDTTINPRSVLKTAKATIEVEALWIDDSFTRILARAKGAVPTSVTMKPYRLKDATNDRIIKSGLPKEHEINPTSFVYMLATELAQVRFGKKSNVLAKDVWRLFYIAGFAVSVSWDSSHSRWNGRVWELATCRWPAGDIVFSCN